EGCAARGDIFLDYGVSGNVLSRPGFNALLEEVAQDLSVSHVFIPRRDRVARPTDPVDGVNLETRLRYLGTTLVFMDRTVGPLAKGQRPDVSEAILSLIDYDTSGRQRYELAQKMIYAQISLAKQGFSVGGRPPFGFCRWLLRADGSPVRLLAN